MNTLYSILVSPSKPSGWYAKQIEDVTPLVSKRSQAIKDILLTGVPGNSLSMFVCVVCYMVLASTFGEEIKKLDSNNTYFNPARPKDAAHNDPLFCFHQIVQPASVLQAIKYHLDTDIQERMNPESWVDLMAAGCLQLLRET